MSDDLTMRVPPSWLHEPIGPFRLIVTDMERFLIDQWLMFDAFDEALAAFVAGTLPVRPWWGSTLTDRDDFVVAAHNSCPHWQIHWIGVRAAYEEIARNELMDPIDLELVMIEAELPWRDDG